METSEVLRAWDAGEPVKVFPAEVHDNEQAEVWAAAFALMRDPDAELPKHLHSRERISAASIAHVVGRQGWQRTFNQMTADPRWQAIEITKPKKSGE